LGSFDAGQSGAKQGGHETRGPLALFHSGDVFQALISGSIGIGMAKGVQQGCQSIR
jgi:hypothetical protein